MDGLMGPVGAFVVATPLVFVLLALIAGAAATVTRPWWRHHPALAPAYGLLGLGVAAQLAWIACWVSRWLDVVFVVVLVSLSVTVLVRDRCWGQWRTWLPTVSITATVGLFNLSLGFLYSGATTPWTSLGNRFRAMPNDNQLPELFADRLWRHQSTVDLIAGWHGSDRPPLQSGILLLARPLMLPLGAHPDAGDFSPAVNALAITGSLWSQVVWVPAVLALVGAFGHSLREARMTVVALSALPTFLVNGVFTWPKLLAAGLAVAALALLVHVVTTRSRAVTHVVAATALATLSYLSHGTTAFAAPLILGFGSWAIWAVAARDGARRTDSGRWCAKAVVSGLSAAVGGLIYLPWQLYGRVSDPFTGRLLKWHLAGMPDGDANSVTADVRHAYASTTWGAAWASRRNNLTWVLDPALPRRASFDATSIAAMREADFFHTTRALGWGTILTVALVVALSLRSRHGVARHRAGRPRAGDAESAALHADRARALLWAIGLSLVSIGFWVAVLFGPNEAVVHQGSLVWIVCLTALPFARLAAHSTVAAWTVIGLTLLYSALVYLPPGAPAGAPGLPASLPMGFCLIVTLITLVTLAGMPARGSLPQQAAAGEDDGPRAARDVVVASRTANGLSSRPGVDATFDPGGN